MGRSGAILSLNIPYRKNATSITSSPEHLLHFERTRTLVAGISAKGYRCRMIGVLPARTSRICLARVERPSLSSLVTVTMSPGLSAAISFASWRPIGTRAVAPTALRFLLPAEVPVLCAHPGTARPSAPPPFRNAAEYRQYAQECVASARSATSDAVRTQFLELAKLWLAAGNRRPQEHR